MDKIIFSQIELSELVEAIKSAMICELKNQGKTDKPAEADRWLNLDELCQYHPDKPSKMTVYGWVQAGSIPVHKGGKKLRFLKSEIDRWLLQGRKQSTAEIEAESKTERDTYLLTKRKGGKL
jgi:excisionase family DNA binding protein